MSEHQDREHLEMVCDNATVGFLIINAEQHCTYMNPAAVEMTGYTLEEVQGRPLHDVVHRTRPDDPSGARCKCPIARALPTQRQQQSEEVFVHKNGSFYDVAVTASPQFHHGKVAGAVIELQSIGRRKQAETALHESEANLQAAVRGAQVVAARIDRELRYQWICNPHPDFNQEAVLGKRDDELDDSEGARRLVALKRRVLEAGASEREEISFARSDGTRVYDMLVEPLRGPDGAIVGAVSAAVDITERKQAEEATRNNERLLRGVFDIIPVGIWIADSSGQLIHSNREAERIWGGSTSNHAMYKGWWAESGNPVAQGEWGMARAISRGETSLGELIRIQSFDGTYKTIVHSAMPLRDETGEIIAGIMVNEDVSHLIEVEDALRRAVRARDELMGIVAHDLRNPLRAIALNADLLADPTRSGSRGAKAVETIVRQAARLDRQIQDLLDVASIDAGSLALHVARVNPQRVLAELMEDAGAAVGAGNHRLELKVEEAPPDICADPHRLLQVLENLVGNAVKFTPAGGRIELGAVQRGDDVMFWVADTGAGIPAEHLSHVFDRFWRTQRDNVRSAGLGLAIVNGIVTGHGGRIWVDSRVGEGTTFFFTIPTFASVPPARPHV